MRWLDDIITDSVINAHEFELAPGVGDGQVGLAYCITWGCKESDITEQLNQTELNWPNSNPGLPALTPISFLLSASEELRRL